MSVTQSSVLCAMRVILVIDFNFDISKGKASFGDQIFNFKFECLIFDIFELIEVDGDIREELIIDNSENEYEQLQEDIKVFPAYFNHSKIPVDDGRDDYHEEYALHKQIIYVVIECFRGAFVFLVYYLHLVGLQWHHKCLLDEGIDQPVPECPLELALHVDEGNDACQVVPDKGPYISHNEETLQAGLDGETKHLKGEFVHGVCLRKEEIFKWDMLGEGMRGRGGDEGAFELTVIDVLLADVPDDDIDYGSTMIGTDYDLFIRINLLSKLSHLYY